MLRLNNSLHCIQFLRDNDIMTFLEMFEDNGEHTLRVFTIPMFTSIQYGISLINIQP